jgi:6-phosphogluconolactonase (cycloisomerase 2 family)
MFKQRLAIVGLAAAVALSAVTAATAAPRDNGRGAVYTLTNAATGNAVLVYTRSVDGTLAPAGSYPTGGLGAGAALGSQGALVLSDDGRQLLAVNAGSDSVSLFSVRDDSLQLESTVPSGGPHPISVTVDGDLVYVLNAGGTGSISGFTIDRNVLKPLAGSTRALGGGSAGPAQVQFSPDGRLLAVTEKTSSTIDVYAVGKDGRAGAPVVSHAAGATPFGFDFDKRGHLIASEAGGTASSYAVSAGGVTAISGAVATHQAAPCWAIVTKNGKFAYTANAGSGTLSGFSVAHDGSLALLTASGVSADLGAGSHPLDLGVTNDGRFLYDLTDGSHVISGFRVGPDGSLAAAGTVAIPVGAAGIAAR